MKEKPITFITRGDFEIPRFRDSIYSGANRDVLIGKTYHVDYIINPEKYRQDYERTPAWQKGEKNQMKSRLDKAEEEMGQYLRRIDQVYLYVGFAVGRHFNIWEFENAFFDENRRPEVDITLVGCKDCRSENKVKFGRHTGLLYLYTGCGNSPGEEAEEVLKGIATNILLGGQ